MKAAIYNPYLNTLGGGERYSVGVAESLKNLGYEVFFQWKNVDLKNKIEERFGVDMDGIEFIPDIKRGEGYEMCFWVSDGSIPLLHSRKNFLHFQIPFKDVNGKTLLNRMKLYRINKVICNSQFTKKFIDKEYGVNSTVIYPPVWMDHAQPKRKENIILYVGRYSSLKQAKRHDILVNAFKKFYDTKDKSYKLILAGGSGVGTADYVSKLKDLSVGYPILILENPPFEKLQQIYAKAKFFWSAAGYGIDENKNPEKVEHFGITLVEAMSYGCICIVYNAGGHKEIISNSQSGYLFNTPTELVNLTAKIVKDKDRYNSMSKKARADAERFSYNIFEKDFYSLVD